MNDELERMLKEAVVACLAALSSGTEENHEKPLSS
jgi:hypothetical protein